MSEHKQLLPFNPAPLPLDERKPEDWVMGAATGITGKPLVEDGNWIPYCPPGEVQKNSYFDSYNCTGFAYTNRVEILWKRVFGLFRNFSDRALGILANTRPPGNSPQAVAEAARHGGLLDEHLLPFDESVKSVEQFYSPSPLTSLLARSALAFLKLCSPKHDYVPTNSASLKEALKFSPLMVTATAWYRDARGLYYFPPGMPPNHDTSLVNIESDGTYVVFDSYPDETGSYFKRLRPDCQFQQAKRYWLAPPEPEPQNTSAFQRFITRILELFFPPPFPRPEELYITPDGTLPPPAPTPEPVPTPHVTKISTWAKAIEVEEGGKPGDLNTVLKNPGNLKYGTLLASWGATKGRPASDGGFIAEFSTYEKGFQALCNFLTLACKDELKYFHDARSLKTFTQKYANPPANHPYAENVARKLGVDVNTNIAQLL